MVEVLNLTKLYKAQKAVDNISFLAQKGEILGFLGPNGAGKSTTMKIATCFIPPTSGTIIVEGHDVVDQAEEVKNIIGYLPEHNPLYLDMYVKEYLSMIGEIHQLPSRKITERVKEMISTCGLTLEQSKKIGALSKGYRQRVGLAQALLHDPRVLILDEPTTGLDPNQIFEIRELIKSVGKEKTVILSTHIMQEVQALCNKVVIINRGRIVANDKVENLTSLQSNHRYVLLELETDVDTALLTLDGISEIVRIEKGRYRIRIDSRKDVRNEIFKKTGELHWPVVGLKQEENSLENIFKQLTGQEE